MTKGGQKWPKNMDYFTNRLISDFDVKKEGSLTGFQKKFSFGEMGPKIGPKNRTSS